SSLPLTGGKGLLFISLSSSALFILGAGIWWATKKRRRSGRSSFGKHA
ncbi:MAG: LPXTG cell wall anchor domain-containing protein, partial [Aeriscardovia sp.]|nr:LPXTG cell wall anchor domain-containing protein [Aeriscardovia sp.]